MIKDTFSAHRSIFSRKRLMLASFIIVATFLTLFSLQGKKTEASMAYVPSDEEIILELTNNERIKNGASPLAWNYSLFLAARAKAYHMLEYKYFEHIAPDGTTPWDFIEGSGYNYLVAGENLAIDFYSYADLMKAWMDSPKHRSNVIDDEFVNIGIAVIKGEFDGRETSIIVQMFGFPAPENIK